MRVNVARVWEDSDYTKVKELCDSTKGWEEVYKKGSTRVSRQSIEGSTMHMVKATSHWDDVSADTAYDVLHDPDYRHKWDRHMATSETIGLINPNNDVCYYALSSIAPVRARDFVLQRSWLDTGREKLICSHSVCHDDYPPAPSHIRASVLLSGYLIREAGNGCTLTYFSHADPKGKLPSWLVNRMTKVVAPKIIKRLHKACLAYPAWKSKHNADWKPWNRPDQQVDARRVDLSRCVPREYDQPIIDESAIEGGGANEDDDED